MTRARLATRSDVPALADVLASAFSADPLWRWLVPDDEHWAARAPAMFAAEVGARLQNGHTYTVDDGTVAALWIPPSARKEGVGEMAAQAVPALRLLGVGTVRRGLRVLRALQENRPRARHWYLATLGTHADHQGRGVGAVALAPVLERCDLDGIGAYLESSNPANLSFYERRGFRPKGTIRPDGSPPMTLMWREPQPIDEP